MNTAEILKIIRENQNPTDSTTITYSFIGLILLFASFGFIYGFKKGITFLVATLVSMTIGFFTYEYFGELIYQEVLLTQLGQTDIDSLVTSLSTLGVNLKEIAYGSVGIIYILILTFLGTFILGTPAYFIVKKLILKGINLSMKEKPIGWKLGNRFLGMTLAAASSILLGFFLLNTASPTIGLFYNPNEVALHKAFVGEQTDEENEGRLAYKAVSTASELTNEKNKETINNIIDLTKSSNSDSTNTVKDILAKKELIETLDNSLDLIRNALKKEESSVQEVLTSLEDLGLVEDTENLATEITTKLKDIIEANPKPLSNYFNTITEKLEGETDADVVVKKELVKKAIETLKLISNKLVDEDTFTTEENEKLQEILNTYK